MGWRLRRVSEELGLTFIKIGQILSMRYDLLSEDDCSELQQLLDNVNPLSWSTVQGILKKNYQKPLDKIFSSIEERPLASASVSQVHRAVLLDGRKVVIKVKRPQVDKMMKKDIAIMRALAKLAEILVPYLRRIKLKRLVNYFESSLLKDIDFVREADNVQAVYDQYEFCREQKVRDDLGVGFFPRPHHEWCTDEVLVMDYIDGISLNRADEFKNNPAYDPQKSIKTYAVAGLRNIMLSEEYVFQSDPHLSNILVLPHGDASSVDCGLMESMTKEQSELVRRCLVAVYLQDLDETMRCLLGMSQVDYDVWAPVIRPDMEKYLKQTKQEGIGFWFLEVVRIFVRHGIDFPEFLFAYGRSNIVLDGVVKTFFNGHTTLDILGEELRSMAMRQMFRDLTTKDWVPLLYALSKAIQTTPDFITQALNNPEEALLKIRKIFS